MLSLVAGVTNSCELFNGVFTELDPSKEQYMLLTAKPSRQLGLSWQENAHHPHYDWLPWTFSEHRLRDFKSNVVTVCC